jgi:hypothetical protein
MSLNNAHRLIFSNISPSFLEDHIHVYAFYKYIFKINHLHFFLNEFKYPVKSIKRYAEYYRHTESLSHPDSIHKQLFQMKLHN